MNYDKDSDDKDIPELEELNHENEDEEEDASTRVPINRKNTELDKDDISNNPIFMQEKLETMNVNDSHHK